MQEKIVAAAVQMSSGDNWRQNLRRAGELIARAADMGAQLVALPEFFPLMAAAEDAKLALAEADGAGPMQDFLARAAARRNVYLVGGTIPMAADARRVFNSCLLFAPDGRRLARYDKIHLFRYRGKTEAVDEARTMKAGGEPRAVDTAIGRIGLCVCYDLRFPTMFARMRFPDIIVAPSAFTAQTGRAHWRLLARARAVDNLAFVVAPAQAGTHPGGRRTFGDSLIVDPWGRVLAAAGRDGDGVVCAELTRARRDACRARLPLLQSKRTEQ